MKSAIYIRQMNQFSIVGMTSIYYLMCNMVWSSSIISAAYSHWQTELRASSRIRMMKIPVMPDPSLVYNWVRQVSLMVSCILLDEIALQASLLCLGFLMESVMEAPYRTFNPNVNRALPIVSFLK